MACKASMPIRLMIPAEDGIVYNFSVGRNTVGQLVTAFVGHEEKHNVERHIEIAERIKSPEFSLYFYNIGARQDNVDPVIRAHAIGLR